MATLEEQFGVSTTGANTSDVNWAVSMAAAVPSGIFKIFEGAATLGATLMDLGVDEDRAEAVEQYFADINPFDELAEATAIGKITELIVNIGVPGGAAFKIGSGLGKIWNCPDILFQRAQNKHAQFANKLPSGENLHDF